MRPLLTRIIRKLKSLFVQFIPYNLSYRPTGTYSTLSEYIASCKGKQPEYVRLYPAYRSSLKIEDSFLNKCSPHFEHPVHVSIPPSAVVEVPNGRLYTDTLSNVSVITEDNKLLGEASLQLGEGQPEDSHIFRQQFFSTPKKYKGTVFQILIGGSGDDNYFHWLFDALPRIHFLQKSGWFDQVDWFVVPRYKHHFQKATLRLLGIGEDKIIEGHQETHIQADRLLASTYARYGDHIPVWVCDFLRKSFSDTAMPDAASPSHIYISRSDSGSRVVANEAELLEVLDNHGFTKITLSDLSFQEQVKVFAAAKVIVAPHGAGLANLVFCEKGTKVVELFADGYVLPLYYDLANKVGLDYSYLVCQTEAKASDVKQAMKLNISVNIEKFKSRLDRLFEVGALKYLVVTEMTDMLSFI